MKQSRSLVSHHNQLLLFESFLRAPDGRHMSDDILQRHREEAVLSRESIESIFMCYILGAIVIAGGGFKLQKIPSTITKNEAASSTIFERCHIFVSDNRDPQR